VIVPARPSKAVGEDTALQIFTKGLADVKLRQVVITLAVELACTGKFMPRLKMFGNGSV